MSQIVIDLSKRPEKIEIIRGGVGMPVEDMVFEDFGFDDISAEAIAVEEIPSETISLEEARAEIQKAYDQGFEDGKQVSTGTYAAELNRHREWIQNFDSIVIGLRSQFAAHSKELESSVVSLATVIAEHILQYEIDKDSSNTALQQARKALQNLRSTETVRIRLNPVNIEALRNAQSSLMSENSNLRRIEFISDELVAPGGCIAESGIGTIDAQLATQLMKMRDTLNQVGPEDDNPVAEADQILNQQQQEPLSVAPSFETAPDAVFSVEENFSEPEGFSGESDILELPPAEENFLLPGGDENLDNLGFDNFSFDDSFPELEE